MSISPVTSTASGLSVDIGHAPVARHRPALDGIEVVDGAERSGQTADVHQLFQGGLHVAGLVRSTALQNHRFTVPEPGKSESGDTDRQDWLLEGCKAPVPADVDRHSEARKPPATAPGEAGVFVEARRLQLLITERQLEHR